MNPFKALRFFGVFPVEADAILRPRWLLPLEYVSPSVGAEDGLQFAHPESGLAYDLELASMLTVATSTIGAWGH